MAETAPESPPAAALTWHETLDSAVETARDRGGPILVDLYAAWCGWCKTLEDEVFSTAAFAELVERENATLLRVDTEDGAEGTRMQARYGATSLPTTLWIDADLVRIGRVKGYSPTAAFLTHLENELFAWDRLVSAYPQVLAEAEPDFQRRIAEDFHSRGDAPRAAALYARVLERVEPTSRQAAWLHTMVADVRRIGRDFDQATDSLATAAQGASTLEDAELAERIDLLRFQIAHDRGDCPQAVASLESFLVEHPKSVLRRQLRRTLDHLKSDERCT
ncbi:MAG: thioredoxin family protein [Acidobacteriota bacterium]